jgi:histidyl-tRNA synthetase
VKFQAVRGMQDLLPEQKVIFRFIEDAAREIFSSYAYKEMGMPILESTQLYKRVVGEATDIVEKEMYTFDDRNGDSLTMRPEGTAGCVRIAQQHGLLFNQTQRLWYQGPMFRHERPQKGRYRQFDQIGVECFGMAGPDIDVEVLLLCARLWEKLGIADEITLELNSMGSAEARASYQSALVSYLTSYEDQLDEDSVRRLQINPLRILDSKVATTQDILVDAPKLANYLDDESKVHFERLTEMLDALGISYRINPKIVRGLDYYNRTVFEWVTSSLGAQGTVCGGGRYDGLVEQIGGKATPGVGFAMGLDRLALMVANKWEASAEADVYIASIGEDARLKAIQIAEAVRIAYPNRKTLVHCGDGKFKSQLKKADASGASVALIVGEEEVQNNKVTVKWLKTGDQETINQNEVAEFLALRSDGWQTTEQKKNR